jgi:hypothetical protein
VTRGRRRLVALAAVLAPARAARLLSRLGEPEAAAAVRLAERLATAPRRVRLAALAAALPEAGPAARPGAGAPLPCHPLLRRLELEQRERTVAERTAVRGAGVREGHGA